MTQKKSFLIVLILLFFVLQYKLWFSEGGLVTMWHLKKNYQKIEKKTDRLEQRNQTLMFKVKAMKASKVSVEKAARAELGMVQEGEDFYQIVQAHNQSNTKKENDENITQ
jgi:cell division protein FtsB